jgi:hypothetical protein
MAGRDDPGMTDPAALEALQTRLGRRLRELRVVLQDHGLILRGYATSYHAK